MAEERVPNRNTPSVKLLITSTDCDPKAELPLSNAAPPVTWNAIVDALNHAKYCLAMHRLTPPTSSNLSLSATKNPNTIPNPQKKIAFLSLQASKKAAFLYSDDDVVNTNYQISYDENMMNELPSFHNLKALPRFHLFTALPEDMQLNIVKLLHGGGGGFTRMRCVSRHFSRLKWNNCFDILQYSHPKVEKSKNNRHFFLDNAFLLLRFASAACMVAVVYDFVNKFQLGACVDEDEEYE